MRFRFRTRVVAAVAPRVSARWPWAPLGAMNGSGLFVVCFIYIRIFILLLNIVFRPPRSFALSRAHRGGRAAAPLRPTAMRIVCAHRAWRPYEEDASAMTSVALLGSSSSVANATR